jgi:hypothetical protein
MSLLNIINKIRDHIIDNEPTHTEMVSSVWPTVYIGDVYSVNNYTNIQYPLYVISQGTHNYNIEKNYVYYNLTIFYIDNIIPLGGEYKSTNVEWGYREVPISIQSSAILNFFTLIKQLEDDGYLIDNINNVKITPFTEKFNDVCSGVYIEIKIREELTQCDVWFGQEGDEAIGISEISETEIDGVSEDTEDPSSEL